MTAVVTTPRPAGAVCAIRDADADEVEFCDLVVAQSGLGLTPRTDGVRVRVALRHGQVAGFAAVVQEPDHSRLDYVFVHHHARGSGVGRALVDDARLHVETGGSLRIESHPSAETFFRRLGACREGTLQPDERHPFCRPLFSVR